MNTTIKTSVLLFFIDGLGIGEKNNSNPLSQIKNIEPLSNFKDERKSILHNGIIVSTDPRLGVEGRPQSASGQTTILTGINAPKVLGKHKQGFPNQQLREILHRKSIFLQLKNKGVEPSTFANVYTPQFFNKTPRWKSATTVAVEAAEIPFRRLPDLVGGFGVFHDFTNLSLRSRGFDVPIYSTQRVSKILAKLSRKNRFTLYEHFITDKIGHDQNVEKAKEHLPKLSAFIRQTLEKIDFEKTTFILTSDHGNIEDLSVRNHTLNDVPTIIWGRKKEETAEKIKDLSDITPAILDLLN